MSSLCRAVQERTVNENHAEKKWLEELRSVRPNLDGRDPYIDPNFINPEFSRLDPNDPNKNEPGDRVG